MKRLLFILGLLCSFILNAQDLKFKGTIMSEGELLPFATIGIRNKNVGTIADENGVFELIIPADLKQDTLKVSYLGYRTRSFIPSQVGQNSNWKINLDKNILQLRPVVVVDKRAKRLKMGGRKEYDFFVWLSAEGNGAEVASLMNPKDALYLSSVGVQMKNDGARPFQLLLNIYTMDPKTELPGEAMLHREVIISSDQTSGWLDVDLQQENLVMDQPFYVAFKWIDTRHHVPLIAINKKMKSFTRKVALGAWDTDYFKWNIRAEGVRIGNK